MNIKIFLVVALFCFADAARPAYGWEGYNCPTDGLTLLELDIEESIRLYPMHGAGWKLCYHPVTECDVLPVTNAPSLAFVCLPDGTLWVRPRAENAYQQVVFESRVVTFGDIYSVKMKLVVGRDHENLVLYRWTKDLDPEKASPNWQRVLLIQQHFWSLLDRLKHEPEVHRASMSESQSWCMASVDMDVGIPPTEFACVESKPDFNDASPILVYLSTRCTFWAKNFVEKCYEQLVVEQCVFEDENKVFIVVNGKYQGALIVNCDIESTPGEQAFICNHFAGIDRRGRVICTSAGAGSP